MRGPVPTSRHNLWKVALGSLFLVAFGVDHGCAAASAARAAAAQYLWQDAGVGGSTTAGTHTWDGTTLTVTGAGAGLNVKNKDQVQFCYVNHVAGDFEIVARLTGFTGQAEATAGIMARGDLDPANSMAAVFFKTKDNSVGWISRVPGTTPGGSPQTFSSGIVLAKPTPPAPPADPEQSAVPAPVVPAGPIIDRPLWIKMVRIGHNFSVYKSRDGKLWPAISNTSGGPIALDGPLGLGFFVSSAADGQPVTATFDSIRIGETRMGYRTSWAGNSFGVENQTSHVSNALTSMWVAPDGTCYTNSWWDEGGRPGTSYRDGKVLRALPGGGPSGEGAITGDAQHLFLASSDKITELEPSASDFAPKPIVLTVNLKDKNGCSVVSGMASDGKQLYVADSRANLVRVVTLGDVPTYQREEAANDRIEAAPAPVVVPDTPQPGEPPFAPAAIYQTRRCGEGVGYFIPGMTPGAIYTFRAHLAAYSDKEPAEGMGKDNVSIGVRDLAGGVLRAFVKDFTGYKADDNGIVQFHFGGYGGSLCGLEVLDADGKRVLAINCGGPTIGDFKGESPELVDHEFAFDRPGPMALDKRGDLWIVQRGNDFPDGAALTAKYPAAIKCYKTDGTFTGRQITDVVDPHGIAYDTAKDHLLVADNGPDLTVRIYGGLDTHPALAGTFGEKGGIYSGAHPGLVNDPASGGYARFVGLSGVGVDASGNLYVGGGFQGTDLRSFAPDGKLNWMLNSLMFCNTYDFDPASDGTEVYGTYNHLHLDLAKTAPGSEQKYVGYNWDIGQYGDPPRAGGSQAIVRRLGPNKSLFLFTSGQGQVSDIKIFRYQGEIAIPAGDIRANDIWIDANGDGKEEPEEAAKMDSQIGWVTTFCVDSKGDIWAGDPGTGGSIMRHFFFKGLNDKGVPLYGATKGDGYEDLPFPEEGAKTNAWGMGCKLDYDANRDTMVVMYPGAPRKGEGDKSAPKYFLARYDNWSKSNRTSTWKIPVLSPYADGQQDAFMYEANLYPYAGYMGMQAVGNYVFMAYLFGEVHVFDLNTGKLVQILSAGPEVEGQDAWEDAAMGLRAFKTSSGEYLVMTENSGWGGKDNFFRWKP